jgi:hypothetical protein
MAGLAGLAATLWRWLRRTLLQPETLGPGVARPQGRWPAQPPAEAACAPRNAVDEAEAAEIAQELSPPAPIGESRQSGSQIEDHSSRPIIIIEPSPVLPGEGQEFHRQSLPPPGEPWPGLLPDAANSNVPKNEVPAKSSPDLQTASQADEIAVAGGMTTLEPQPTAAATCLPYKLPRSPIGNSGPPPAGIGEHNAEGRKSEPAIALENAPEVAGATMGAALPQIDSPSQSNGAPSVEPPPLPNSYAVGASPEAPEPRLPSRYRPRLDPLSRGSRVAARLDGSATAPAASGALDAELVLMFQPGGWGIGLALLLRRGQAMADDIVVRMGTNSHSLCAIDDDLFEPITIPDPAVALAAGVAAASIEHPPSRWVRGGRSLHVFTAKTGVAGFVSVPRVIIGMENAVICTDEVAESVLRVCTAVARVPPKEISGPGIPGGWRCFRGIQPVVSEAPDDCGGIFLALVPLPDAIIDLGGGIPISRSSWLSGHPPSIRIVGVDAFPGDVTIDGQPASCNEIGCWVAAGWDAEGSHSIRYAGISRSYEISRSPQSWQSWPAHVANGLVLCGALAGSPMGRPIFASAAGPVWLIGCGPGEAGQAQRTGAAPFAMATTSFEPVWAVPVRYAKSRNRQLPQLIGRPTEPAAIRSVMPKAALRLWCQILRDGPRDPRLWPDSDREVASLWMRYRQAARTLWKRSR